jgi:hypothetical protein
MLKNLWQSLKRVWAVWARFAHKIGNFQARVLLSVLYAVFVFPFGVIVHLFSDPLRIKKRPTSWLDHPDEPSSLEWARKQ